MDNFNKACLQSCQEWVDSFEYETDYELSKSFEKKVNILFDKMRNDKYHVFTRRAVRTLIIVAIILSFATTVFAIPSTREYIIKKFSNHSTYSVVDSSNFENVEDLNLGYIPNGFEKNNEFTYDYLITVDYKNSEKWFSVDKSALNSEINYDTEDNNAEEIIDNNTTYVIHNSNNSSYGVVWNDGKYIYTIDGNISKEEMIKIALNVE